MTTTKTLTSKVMDVLATAERHRDDDVAGVCRAALQELAREEEQGGAYFLALPHVLRWHRGLTGA